MRQTRGFTLIELMIVLAIVGLLSAIAIPSYMEHVRKTRRVDAQATLMQLAYWMERQYTRNSSYNVDGLPEQLTRSDYYRFELSNQGVDDFTLSAIPLGSQRKDRCETLTLNNTGQRGAKEGEDDCW